MLTELVREDGGVEPVERHVAAIDHFDQRIEHRGLLAGLVAKAEVFFALDEAQRFDARHLVNSRIECASRLITLSMNPKIRTHSSRPHIHVQPASVVKSPTTKANAHWS